MSCFAFFGPFYFSHCTVTALLPLAVGWVAAGCICMHAVRVYRACRVSRVCVRGVRGGYVCG
jgi:hypothetical protein